MANINAQEIKEYRNTYDCSLLEAKRCVVKRKVLGLIERAKAYDSISDLCAAMTLFVEENS